MLAPGSPSGGLTLNSMLSRTKMRSIMFTCLFPSHVIAVGCNPIRTGSLSAVVGSPSRTEQAYYTSVIVTGINLLRHR